MFVHNMVEEVKNDIFPRISAKLHELFVGFQQKQRNYFSDFSKNRTNYLSDFSKTNVFINHNQEIRL